MKTKSNLVTLTMTAAALSMSATTSVGQLFSPKDPLNNRAVATSPRAKEAFPWLTRIPSVRTDACCEKDEEKNTLTEAKKNRAYAASPRVRELFPELGVTPMPPRAFSIAPLVEKNEAVKSSPRYREQHPETLRGTSTGTYKGGASKLVDLGK